MFKIAPVTRNLLVINILLYFATGILKNNGVDLNNVLGLHFFLSDSFMPYQLFTYMFMHASFEHIFFNMLAFWMFGRILEHVWGAKRYLIFYLVCGIGAGICQEVAQYVDYVHEGLGAYSMVTDGAVSMPMSEYLNTWTTVGASGAVYGILLGFGMSFPNERVMLLIPPIPLKAKYLVAGYAVIELLSGLGTSNSNIAHFAHLGGMLFGMVLILIWRRKARLAREGFTSWREYKPEKEGFWSKIKKKAKPTGPHMASEAQTEKKTEPTDAMAARRAQQAEVDRILDKVKKSGYGCLTEQEKKTIFDFRNR